MKCSGVFLEESVQPCFAQAIPSDRALGVPDSIHQLIDNVAIALVEHLRLLDKLIDDLLHQLNHFLLRLPSNVMDACNPQGMHTAFEEHGGNDLRCALKEHPLLAAHKPPMELDSALFAEAAGPWLHRIAAGYHISEPLPILIASS